MVMCQFPKCTDDMTQNENFMFLHLNYLKYRI